MNDINYIQATLISLSAMLMGTDKVLFKKLAALPLNEAMPIIADHYGIKKIPQNKMGLLIEALTILPAEKNGLLTLTEKGREYFGYEEDIQKKSSNAGINEEKTRDRKDAKGRSKTKNDIQHAGAIGLSGRRK